MNIFVSESLSVTKGIGILKCFFVIFDFYKFFFYVDLKFFFRFKISNTVPVTAENAMMTEQKIGIVLAFYSYASKTSSR